MKYYAVYNYYTDEKYNYIARIIEIMKGYRENEAAHPEQENGGDRGHSQ